MKEKIIMSFISLGDYRLGVMKEVHKAFNDNLLIYAGDVPNEKGIKTLTRNELNYKLLRNKILPGKFVIQNIPFKEYIACDKLLMDLNPRLLTAWPILFIRFFLKKPTILWGHAWPRTGKSSFSDLLRGFMRKVATNVMVYTETQAKELSEKEKSLQVYFAPNALYNKNQMKFYDNPNRNHIIYVGRLVSSKKPMILLESFIKACDDNDFSAKLTFVGDGEQMPLLLQRVIDVAPNIAERIAFLGHISDYSKLSNLYNESFVSVSPGYVGLSITQSFSFGVPMIISKNENHSPEIEAAIEGINADFFETDSIIDLANKLSNFYNNRRSLQINGPIIVKHCQDKYSVENMASHIVSAINCLS